MSEDEVLYTAYSPEHIEALYNRIDQLRAERNKMRDYLWSWRQELRDRIDILELGPHKHVSIHIETWESMLDEVDGILYFVEDMRT